MKWEIERAKQEDTNLKFAAVIIKSGNAKPAGLLTILPLLMDSPWKG